MSQIWNPEEWEDIPLKEVKEKLIFRSFKSPRLGDMRIWDLCSLAIDENSCEPVGVYVFIDSEDNILYAGKTHGRSLHERMVSHIDHRNPIVGSPHLARLVQSIVKTGDALTGSAAVIRLLNMRVLWLPVQKGDLSDANHKNLIAIIERRLLWNKCLDPRYNSQRVKKNDQFTLKGTRYNLDVNILLGER